MLHTGRHSCHGDGFLFQWQPQRLFGQISQWIGGNCKFLAVLIIQVRLANLSETDGLQTPSRKQKVSLIGEGLSVPWGETKFLLEPGTYNSGVDICRRNIPDKGPRCEVPV